jgi:hypothetical protein
LRAIIALKSFSVNFRPVREKNRAMNRVFKLSNIAPPSLGRQKWICRRRNAAPWDPI